MLVLSSSVNTVHLSHWDDMFPLTSLLQMRTERDESTISGKGESTDHIRQNNERGRKNTALKPPNAWSTAALKRLSAQRDKGRTSRWLHLSSISRFSGKAWVQEAATSLGTVKQIRQCTTVWQKSTRWMVSLCNQGVISFHFISFHSIYSLSRIVMGFLQYHYNQMHVL